MWKKHHSTGHSIYYLDMASFHTILPQEAEQDSTDYYDKDMKATSFEKVDLNCQGSVESVWYFYMLNRESQWYRRARMMQWFGRSG